MRPHAPDELERLRPVAASRPEAEATQEAPVVLVSFRHATRWTSRKRGYANGWLRRRRWPRRTSPLMPRRENDRSWLRERLCEGNWSD